MTTSRTRRQATAPQPGQRHPRLRLWGWPAALGLLSASGLLSALVSDAWGDVWSWVALGVPVLVMGRCAMRR
jgi:Flp pilus assembly protein TadB